MSETIQLAFWTLLMFLICGLCVLAGFAMGRLA